jgi:hypothetical protein
VGVGEYLKREVRFWGRAVGVAGKGKGDQLCFGDQRGPRGFGRFEGIPSSISCSLQYYVEYIQLQRDVFCCVVVLLNCLEERY